MVARIDPQIMMVALLLLSGCSTRALPRSISPDQLKTHGVLAGSFVLPFGDPTRPEGCCVSKNLTIKSMATGKTSIVSFKPYPRSKYEVHDEHGNGTPFAILLPEGNYEITGWSVERRVPLGQMTIVRNSSGELVSPVSVRAGQIRYVGCLDVLNLGGQKAVLKFLSDSNPGPVQFQVEDQSARDLAVLRNLYPHLPWQNVVMSMELADMVRNRSLDQ
ncbi:MAG: hypothetical protein R3C20_21335 [Planctomycetaceae bacterium]